MPTLKVTVDLDCCRCSAKIWKVLSSIQERRKFVIEKIVYADDTVLVTGPFDAEKLSCKLWCKAGNIIKKIEVVKPKADDKPKKEDEKKPKTPCYQLVTYGYLCPTWPCGCGTPCCEGHSKPPPPAPAPTCQCPAWSSCHCHSYPPYQQPMPMQCTSMVICEESPSYGACAVM